jgi:hypothetical protein
LQFVYARRMQKWLIRPLQNYFPQSQKKLCMLLRSWWQDEAESVQPLELVQEEGGSSPSIRLQQHWLALQNWNKLDLVFSWIHVKATEQLNKDSNWHQQWQLQDQRNQDFGDAKVQEGCPMCLQRILQSDKVKQQWWPW